MLVVGVKPFGLVYLILPDGREITVQVMPPAEGREDVRLGFDAPHDVIIERAKVREMRRREAETA